MDDATLLNETLATTGTQVATHKGFPNPAAERGKTPLSLDALLIPSPATTFLFRIRGHDWHRLGIFDGDIAIADRALTPRQGSIVIDWDPSGTLHISQWAKPETGNTWGVVTAIIHQTRGS